MRAPFRSLPLRPVLAVVGFVATLGAAHAFREHRAAEARKAAILEARDALAEEVAAPMRDLRDKIEPWAVELATRELLVVREPHLPLELGQATVYLRVPLAAAQTKAGVHAAAQTNVVDGLASCLVSTQGGTVHTWGDLVARQDLLGDAFLQAVRTSGDRLSLDAVDRTLARHRDGHHPALVAALRETKLALVAIDEPGGAVRVLLRRLSTGDVLFRARLTPSHGLLTIAGGPPSALAQQQAAACSVGMQLVAAR